VDSGYFFIEYVSSLREFYIYVLVSFGIMFVIKCVYLYFSLKDYGLPQYGKMMYIYIANAILFCVGMNILIEFFSKSSTIGVSLNDILLATDVLLIAYLFSWIELIVGSYMYEENETDIDSFSIITYIVMITVLVSIGMWVLLVTVISIHDDGLIAGIAIGMIGGFFAGVFHTAVGVFLITLALIPLVLLLMIYFMVVMIKVMIKY
jgi:hypothetical protein